MFSSQAEDEKCDHKIFPECVVAKSQKQIACDSSTAGPKYKASQKMVFLKYFVHVLRVR